MPIPLKQSQYPKRIYHKDCVYRVRFVRNLNCYGETDANKKEIRIKSGISPRETFKTFIHELLHVIEFEGPVKIKHKLIARLEEAIVELLLDNFL